MGAGEKEREKGRRERRGFCPLKGQVQRMCTETTLQARALPAYWACMRAGVKHSPKRWAGGLNAHKWYTVTLTCFFIVSSVKANESILLAIAN